jgi:hypothetical protein
VKENPTPQDVTQELIDTVAAYLVLRTKAEVIREQVDTVQRQVLAGITLYNDLEIEHGLDRERITKPNRVYLSQDETALGGYYKAIDAKLRELGIKPADMQLDYCPALVAEHEQAKAEWALIDEAAKMLDTYEGPGQFNNALLSTQNGLETRQKFIDLIVGLVLAL